MAGAFDLHFGWELVRARERQGSRIEGTEVPSRRDRYASADPMTASGVADPATLGVWATLTWEYP